MAEGTSVNRQSVGEYLVEKVAGPILLDQLKPIPLEDIANENTDTGDDFGLYLHIPFCTEICTFCAFHRKVGSSEQQQAYVDSFQTHISEVLSHFSNPNLVGVYVGGGTPGLLSPRQVKTIFDSIDRNSNMSGTPVSFELHPENISEEHITALVGLGVSRFSVGVQNLSIKERAALRRSLTSPDEDIEKLQILNKLDVLYNVDLMFGTPFQTMDSWVHTLDRIITEVSPPDITLYQFVNAYGAETRRLLANGTITQPDARMRKSLYEYACSYLTSNGYVQTGTLFFNRADKVKKRNRSAKGNDFLGLGPKTYSNMGRYVFMNNANTADFVGNRETVDYYGIKIPKLLLDMFFGTAKDQGEYTHKSTRADILRSEAIVKLHSLAYFLTNQPSLSKRKNRQP